jgi:hypothetical protein
MKRFLKSITVSMFLFVLLTPVVSAQWSVGRKYAEDAGTPDGTITDIVGTTMDWLLALLGFFGIIGFVISGIMYLTAAGDDDQISTAKNAMKYSIIGIIVALLGFVIIQAVETLLTGQSSYF